ncbi:hydrogenase expression/formation protein HypE [Candidatus Heimdallarchaeota archaeon B3_Heim]|nr:MAG: hydrogenase expression/formation protein HypE [Candidatus Heimdallarchaeota archaeon B3_Heim]
MGQGGKKMDTLLEFITNRIKIKKISDEGVGVESFDDGAIIPLPNRSIDLVLTTDSFTVSPLFFRGGNIGTLAAAGTINDLLMMGARPIAMTLALVIREGLKFDVLANIIDTISEITEKFKIGIVAGDTKVMPLGSMDETGLIINTTGLGEIPSGQRITDSSIQPKDIIITTGTLGDHGFAMLVTREGIEFETELKSDVAPLQPLIQPILQYRIHAMKDPTRGGLTGVLTEWAKKSNVSIWLDETSLPISDDVQIISDIFGIDPLHVSCEGKAIIAVHPEDADKVLNLIKSNPLGNNAAIIGRAKSSRKGQVFLKTTIGGHRILDKPVGEPIPRVC